MPMTDEQYRAFDWDVPMKDAQLTCDAMNRCVAINAIDKKAKPPVIVKPSKNTGTYPKAFFLHGALLFGLQHGALFAFIRGDTPRDIIESWNMQEGE